MSIKTILITGGTGFIEALSNEAIPIYGDGKNIRDWLYVLDHCKAIDLVSYQGKEGNTYNVGGENERTNLEIVNTICFILDAKVPKEKSYKEQIVFVEGMISVMLLMHLNLSVNLDGEPMKALNRES